MLNSVSPSSSPITVCDNDETGFCTGNCNLPVATIHTILNSILHIPTWGCSANSRHSRKDNLCGEIASSRIAPVKNFCNFMCQFYKQLLPGNYCGEQNNLNKISSMLYLCHFYDGIATIQLVSSPLLTEIYPLPTIPWNFYQKHYSLQDSKVIQS